MRIHRSLAVASALGFSHLCLTAQEAAEHRHEHPGTLAVTVVHEQPGADTAKLTAWISYPNRTGDLLDHQQYLEDLSMRFRERGLAIAVVLPAKDALAVAAGKPRLVVASATEDGALDNVQGMSMTVTAGTSGDAKVVMRSLDAAVDTLELCLKGSFDRQVHQRTEQMLQGLWANVADGGEFSPAVKQCLAVWPRSGRARACAVLNQWWCKGDLAAAKEAIDEGIRALSNEAVPMATFVDLVLRGDHSDPKLAMQLAMAMAPVAAGAPAGTHTQLINLRALLRAGQDRVAGRIVATLPKRLAGNAQQQLILAETLMESRTPAAFRDLAERMIQNAEANGGNRKWVYSARHKVLKRCGEDEAAEKLMDEYRAKNLGSGLNNDAWYLIVQPQTMGRFDTLALAQCEQMQRVEKLDFGSMDTVALAHFVNGKVDEAIELQTTAAQQSQNNPIYLARLRRYQETKAAADARAKQKKAKK